MQVSGGASNEDDVKAIIERMKELGYSMEEALKLMGFVYDLDIKALVSEVYLSPANSANFSEVQ